MKSYGWVLALWWGALGCGGEVAAAARDAVTQEATSAASPSWALPDSAYESSSPPPQDSGAEVGTDAAVNPLCFANHGAKLRWLSRFGDSKSQTTHAGVMDSAGNTWLTGWFGGQIEFGSKGLVAGENTATDTWLAKLGSAHEPLFSTRWQGATPYALATSSTGRVVATGGLQPVVDLGNGPKINKSEPLVISLKADGKIDWMTATTASLSAVGRTVAIDIDSNVVVGGEFAGTLNFGSGLRLEQAGAVSAGFVVRLSPMCGVGWAR